MIPLPLSAIWTCYITDLWERFFVLKSCSGVTNSLVCNSELCYFWLKCAPSSSHLLFSHIINGVRLMGVWSLGGYEHCLNDCDLYSKRAMLQLKPAQEWISAQTCSVCFPTHFCLICPDGCQHKGKYAVNSQRLQHRGKKQNKTQTCYLELCHFHACTPAAWLSREYDWGKALEF